LSAKINSSVQPWLSQKRLSPVNNPPPFQVSLFDQSEMAFRYGAREMAVQEPLTGTSQRWPRAK
jgi:hypothetical protein